MRPPVGRAHPRARNVQSLPPGALRAPGGRTNTLCRAILPEARWSARCGTLPIGKGPAKFRPDRAKSGPASTKFNPESAEFGPNPTKFEAASNKFEPTSAKLGQDRTKYGEMLAQCWPNSVEFVQVWPGVCQSAVRFNCFRPCRDRIWHINESYPKVVERLPAMRLGKLPPHDPSELRACPKDDQELQHICPGRRGWSKLAKVWPKLAGVGHMLAYFDRNWPCRAWFGHKLAKFGRIFAEVCQIGQSKWANK